MSIINSLLAQALAPSIEEMEAVLQPVEGELEETVLEVVEAQGALSDQEEAVARLETTAKSLEAFAIALEARIDASRPLIAGEAHAMRIGLEALLTPCGYSDKQISIGLEEFGEAPIPTEKEEEALQGETFTVGDAPADAPVLSETEAMSASQEALDNVKARLKQFWEAIKAGVLRVWEMIKAFMGKVFSSTKALETRAKALLKGAGDSKLKADDKATLSIPAALSMSGAATPESVVQAAGSLKTTIEGVNSTALKVATAFYAKAKEALKKVEEKQEADVAEVEKAAVAVYNAELPGGLKVQGSTKGGLEVTKGAEVSEAKDAKLPSLAQIKGYASGAVELASVVAAAKVAVDKIAAEHAGVIKEASTLAAAADKGFVGKTIDSAKARWAVKLTQRNFSTAVAKTASIGVKTGFGLVSYGEKALRQYKAEAAK